MDLSSSARRTASSAESSTIKMRNGVAMSMSLILLFRKSEKEGCAAVHLGFCPDPAAVAHYDPLHNSQTRADALELIRGVQSLEHAEELVGELHIEPRAVVLHEIDLLILLF